MFFHFRMVRSVRLLRLVLRWSLRLLRSVHFHRKKILRDQSWCHIPDCLVFYFHPVLRGLRFHPFVCTVCLWRWSRINSLMLPGMDRTFLIRPADTWRMLMHRFLLLQIRFLRLRLSFRFLLLRSAVTGIRTLRWPLRILRRVFQQPESFCLSLPYRYLLRCMILNL